MLLGGGVAVRNRARDAMSAPTHDARHEATSGGASGHRSTRVWLKNAVRLIGVIVAVVLIAIAIVPLVAPDHDVVSKAAAKSKGPVPGSR